MSTRYNILETQFLRCRCEQMSLSTATRILDKKDIPADPNAYVFRDAQRDGTWCLYFYDREAKSRHRLVLKDGNGRKPT